VSIRFNYFIGRLSLATKPRPQKLANFIDRLTRAQRSRMVHTHTCLT